jgi:hypothetical protein
MLDDIKDELELHRSFLIKLDKILSPEMAVRIIFFNNDTKQEVSKMFLKLNQSLPLSVKIMDKDGNVAKVDGLPSWALTDASLGSLEVSADGYSAMFKPSGVLGALKVQVKADADLGEGVKEILGELDVEMVAGEATTVVISAGEPV